jgi:simple sugar transport system permease protein
VEGFGFTGIAVALMGRNHPVRRHHRQPAVRLPLSGRRRTGFEFGVDRNIVVVLQVW